MEMRTPKVGDRVACPNLEGERIEDGLRWKMIIFIDP
jgi:hypothetical protein